MFIFIKQDFTNPFTQRCAARLPGDEPRAVVNVVPGVDGRISGYRLGSRRFDPSPTGLGQLRDALVDLYQATPVMRVNLRADRGTDYRWVAPVLQVVRQAAGLADVGLDGARLNLVVIREDA